VESACDGGRAGGAGHGGAGSAECGCAVTLTRWIPSTLRSSSRSGTWGEQVWGAQLVSGSLAVDEAESFPAARLESRSKSTVGHRHEKRDQHLKSPDRLHAKQFPVLSLQGHRVKIRGGGVPGAGQLKSPPGVRTRRQSHRSSRREGAGRSRAPGADRGTGFERPVPSSSGADSAWASSSGRCWG